MTNLELDDDFATCIDDLEPVTLRRRSSTKEIAVDRAYRQKVFSKESVPSNGAAVQAETVWHLQLATGEMGPQVGDVVIDGNAQRWTILNSEQLHSLGRWKCTSRELSIAYDCRDLVDVERAVWDDIGSGPEIVDWTGICAAVPVSIRLDEMVLDNSTDPPTKQLLYQIVLSESLDLESDDRLVAQDGPRYRVQSMQQAERIDVLPVVTALREDVT